MQLKVNERLKGKRLYKEVWKPVVLLDNGESYEGLYEVSNMGRVRSLDREVIFSDGRKALYKGKIRILSPNKDGYLQVGLCKNSKQKIISVHRLVAEAFIPNPDNKETVNHINGDKTCNTVFNLEWADRSEQLYHAYDHNLKKKMEGNNNPNYGKELSQEIKNKISEANSKQCICIETGEIYKSLKEAGESVGVSGDAISRCIKGKSKYSGKHPITGEPLHWAFVEEEVV